MSPVTSATPPPALFCSPGLRRLLVRSEIANEGQIAQANTAQPKVKILAALAATEVIDEDLVLERVAKELGLDFARLSDRTLLKKIRDAGLAQKVSTGFAYSYRCLPLHVVGTKVAAAFADPLDTEALSALEFLLGAPVQIVLAKEEELVSAIGKLLEFEELEDKEAAAAAASEGELELASEFEGKDTRAIKEGSESAPIVQLVNKLFRESLIDNASDIHFEPTKSGMDVRFRIDGVMVSHSTVSKRLQPYVLTRLKLIAGMDITERRRPQDGRIRTRDEKFGQVDLRVSSVPTSFGESIVIRLLRSNLDSMQLDKLGMLPEMQEQFLRMLSTRDRMIVVTGPTGSGKTTTLYASLLHLLKESGTIITVEDPIEYQVAGITQIQVNEKVGMTFAAGLRSILRQDPDVIMVGEIRDLETAKVALQAAQTGHLVISTLHTNSAPAAVIRLLDLGTEPQVVAASLGAVLAQRLVRRVCSNCAEPASAELRTEIEERFGVSASSAKVGKGCKNCDDSGYKGRIGIYSLLSVDTAVAEVLRRSGSENDIATQARGSGFKPLFDAGLQFVEQGLTTTVELERVLGRMSAPQVATVKKSVVARATSTPSAPAVPVTMPETVDDLLNAFIEAAEKPSSIVPPEAPEEIAQTSIAAIAAQSNKETAGTLGFAVLIVEDDVPVRRVVSRALRKAGFEVCEAENGIDAIERLPDFKPDVIISDLLMPRMDGKALVEHLRASHETKGVPILVLTGSDNEQNEVSLLKAGANDFVSKASSPELVVARVRRLLGIS